MHECERCPDPGMCCRYVELPLARTLSPDEIRWVELHNRLSIRGQVVRIEVTCSALSDGKCLLYGKPERPEMCAVWPDRPAEQAPPGCTYIEILEGGHR